MIKPHIQFQGITRYRGQDPQQLERRIRDDFRQRDFVNASGLKPGEGIVLTGNDMAKFMKDELNIIITPELLAVQNEDQLIETMFNGTPETIQAIGQVMELAMGPENDAVDAKVFAYVEARQAAGSDIDGQPIIDITI